MHEYFAHREYHCRMLLKEIEGLKFEGGTRDAIYIDRSEVEILTELLTKEISETVGVE